MRGADQTKHAAISGCSARNLTPLAQINIDLRRGKFILRAGFDFDETERRSIVSNKVNCGVNNCAMHVATNCQTEVCRHDAIAGTFQMLDSKLLSAPAQFKV